MSLLLILLVVFLLCGGAFGYSHYGYDRYGYGGGIGIVGIILLIVVLFWLFGSGGCHVPSHYRTW